jgi:hypothetical protein
MIELVLIYCLADAPDRCVEKREPVDPGQSATVCIVGAQTYADEYLRSHPDYRLKGWRCEQGKPPESPA